MLNYLILCNKIVAVWFYICILYISMQTVTIDIINDKAIKLLQDLELLEIIRVHKDDEELIKKINPITKYKGKMTRQPVDEIEQQLKELRDSWE